MGMIGGRSFFVARRIPRRKGRESDERQTALSPFGGAGPGGPGNAGNRPDGRRGRRAPRAMRREHAGRGKEKDHSPDLSCAVLRPFGAHPAGCGRRLAHLGQRGEHGRHLCRCRAQRRAGHVADGQGRAVACQSQGDGSAPSQGAARRRAAGDRGRRGRAGGYPDPGGRRPRPGRRPPAREPRAQGQRECADRRERAGRKADGRAHGGQSRPGGPPEYGILRLARDLRPRAGGRDGHGYGHRARQDRGAHARDRAAQDTPAGQPGPVLQKAGRGYPGRLRAGLWPVGFPRRHGHSGRHDVCRGPGRRGHPGGAQLGRHHHPGHRHPEDGQAERHYQGPQGGRVAGLRVGHLLG